MNEDFTQQEFRKNFSQRNGFAAVPPPLNPGEISDQLRLEFNDLLHTEHQEGSWNFRYGGEAADWEKVLASIWVQKFRRPRTFGMQALCLEECHRVIHYRDFDEVFTLIEEFATRIEDKQPTFQKEVNAALTRNQAPYVLYKSPAKGWMIIQTGAEIQRDTVLKCLSDLRDPSFEKTRGHFEKAGGHLAKGESPEAAGQSAKAFEACLRKLVNKPDLSGGQALELYTKIFLLPLPMKEAIHGIWNYRNKTEDVGHSGKEGSQSLPPGKLDAQFIYAATASCIIHLINWSRDQRSS